MNNDRLISISEASRLLGVSLNTLRKWDSNGKLVAVKCSSNHRRYLLSTILEMQGNATDDSRNEQSVAIYCRVSSNDQKQHGDLDRQKTRVMEYCVSKGYKVGYVLDDCCSGMKYNRPKLDKLYELVTSRKISKVVVEHKDRLVRFGFDCIKAFFNSYGVEIEYVEETLPKSFEAELVEDVMSLMTSFTAKLHSRRKRQSKEYKARQENK